MDLPEQDDHNFSTPSSHRLPTVSGTEAIRNARRNARPIHTSLSLLDATLGKSLSFTTSSGGGIQRGVVTEVFGPPGVGKTTFALQAAVNALHSTTNSTSVTWIDTSSQVVRTRLEQLTDAYRMPPGHDPPSSPPLPQCSKETLLAERFNHLQITTLPKLLTLFLYPSTAFPPPNTSLIVLDDLSNLILASLPHSARPNSSRTPQKSIPTIQGTALSKRALTRRFQVLSSLAAGLQKFAATNNVAILVTSKATVNLRAGQRAFLRPALSSQQWDNYLSTRIALYRDFWPDDIPTTQHNENGEIFGPTEFERRSLRFAKVVRLGGKLVSSPEVGFVIEEGGLREILLDTDAEDPSVLPLATQPLLPLEESLGSELEVNEQAHERNPNEDIDNMDVHDEPPLDTPGGTKRKAIEIADSEDEDDDEPGDSEDDLLPASAPRVGFRPSSQVLQEDTEHDIKTNPKVSQRDRASKRASLEVNNKTSIANENTLEGDMDEMLLESFEKQAPPFSQAAAEMSEPLTPSDDDRDLS